MRSRRCSHERLTVRTLVADQLVARRDAPASRRSFQAECVVLVHMLREVRAGHPGPVPRHRASFPRDLRLPRRDGGAVGTQSRERCAPRAPAPGLWQEEHARRAAPPQGRAALRGARRTTTSGSPAFAASSRRRAPNLDGGRAVRAAVSGKTLRKVSPLATWTTREVWDYAKAHDIPLLPLYELGYTSIGCEPCTTLPLDPSDARSGRWGGQKLRMRHSHPAGRNLIRGPRVEPRESRADGPVLGPRPSS